MSINNRKALNPLLSWLWDLLSFYSTGEILTPSNFHDQVDEIRDVLKSDISGLANSILDFSINSAAVDFTIETDSSGFTEIIQEWFKLINKPLIGKIPIGVTALSKEYYRERWKNSSLIVLRTIWEDKTINGVTFNLPTKMWILNGQNVIIKDKSENRMIGEENYYIKIDEKTKKPLPSSEEELIFVQKPYSSWSELYPVPFLMQRGVWRNLKLYDLINKKSERIISKALEYMLLFKKGTEALTLQGKPEHIYSEDDLKQIKDGFKNWQLNSKTEQGIPSYITNFDTEVESVIPDYEKVLKKSLYEEVEKRLLQGMGMIEIIEGSASSRREAILNPKPFIAEVETGINDFIVLLSDVLETIKERNIKNHPKLFGNKMQLHYTPIKYFINDNIRDHLRSMYDRGVISKQTYAEVVGEVDIDIESMRRKEEKEKKYEELFYPPVTQNQENKPDETNVKPAKDTEKIPSDKKGIEKKNYKGNEEEVEETDLEISKVVKRKDGWHVISEKTGKNLGGPYKTKKEAVERLRQVEWFKHQGKTEEEISSMSEDQLNEANVLIEQSLNIEKLEVAKKQKKLLNKLLKEKEDETL